MKKQKLVDESDIDLLGKKADEKKLALYAEQKGIEAVAFLERAFREGHVKMRAAAVIALARIDASKAYALVVAALDALPKKKPPKKEQQALLSCLASIGTREAMVALFERGDENALLFVNDSALRSLVENTSLDAALAQRLRYHALHRGILDDASLLLDLVRTSTEISDRTLAARALLKNHATRDALAAIVAADVDADVVVRAKLALDPAGAGSDLARMFRDEPQSRTLLLASLREVPTTDALDPLVDAANDVAATDTGSSLALLTTLKTTKAVDALLAWAARVDKLDDVGRRVLHALGALGDPRAAAVLIAWLEKPEGREVSPMLLSAIGACGRASDVDRLRSLAAHEPSRASFYGVAIASCAARA